MHPIALWRVGRTPAAIKAHRQESGIDDCSHVVLAASDVGRQDCSASDVPYGHVGTRACSDPKRPISDGLCPSAEARGSPVNRGIDPAFLPFVFDRFRQGRREPSGRFKPGLGLGLTIARHLVELHGGTLRAESAGLGLGATFTVALPIPALAERPREAASGTRSGPTESLEGFTILIVEDDADSRESLKLTLESYGARVVVCDSAKAALEAIDKAHPNVLVSDIGLPEMDGYALLSARRYHEAVVGAQVLPAIALTAYGRIEDRERAFAAGFQAHLIKPVAPETLVMLIRNLVRPG